MTERNIPAWSSAVLFIGSKGMLIADYNKHQLLPEEKFVDFQKPAPFIPPGIPLGIPLGEEHEHREPHPDPEIEEVLRTGAPLKTLYATRAPTERAFEVQIGALPMPVHLCIGNHDDRAAFLSVFPEMADENGFVQGVFDLTYGTGITLDTWGPNTHAGHFCDIRCSWLDARLAEADGPAAIDVRGPAGVEAVCNRIQHVRDYLVVLLSDFPPDPTAPSAGPAGYDGSISESLNELVGSDAVERIRFDPYHQGGERRRATC